MSQLPSARGCSKRLRSRDGTGRGGQNNSSDLFVLQDGAAREAAALLVAVNLARLAPPPCLMLPDWMAVPSVEGLLSMVTAEIEVRSGVAQQLIDHTPKAFRAGLTAGLDKLRAATLLWVDLARQHECFPRRGGPAPAPRPWPPVMEEDVGQQGEGEVGVDTPGVAGAETAGGIGGGCEGQEEQMGAGAWTGAGDSDTAANDFETDFGKGAEAGAAAAGVVTATAPTAPTAPTASRALRIRSSKAIALLLLLLLGLGQGPLLLLHIHFNLHLLL